MANDHYQDVDLDACYEMGAGEAYDNAVKSLIKTAKAVMTAAPGIDRDFAMNELGEAILNVEPFFEETDDPRSNGWVGQDGRP